ncbi:MAG: hypothetical protein COB81_11095 [Flavobacteriaceae bacterium]|nr:MAG: hypothetical protein COB81_11095 [Flavobacteriaceae bacterium]
MQSAYKILISEKLVLKKFSGEVTIDDMKEIFKIAKELHDLHPNYQVLNDYTQASFKFNKDDFTNLMSSFTKSHFPFKPKNFIVKSPKQFVMYSFYKDNYKFKNTAIFNTIEGACSSIRVNPSLVKEFFST